LADAIAGGHTKAPSYLTFPHHAQTTSISEAIKIALLEHTNIQSVHAFASEYNIPCEAAQIPTVDVHYTSPETWAQTVKDIQSLKTALPPEHPAAKYEILGREDVMREYLVVDQTVWGDRVQGGVRYPAGRINAYRFTLGVLRECLKRGLNLQTNSPVIKLEKLSVPSPNCASSSTGWAIHTPRGVILTRRVVLATNGYTAAISGPPQSLFQGRVVPVRGQITAQRPGSKLPFRGCLPTTYSFIYGPSGFEYMITRPCSVPEHESGFDKPGSASCAGEGEIIIGGGLIRGSADGMTGASEIDTTDDGVLSPGITTYLYDTPARYFGPDHWGQDHCLGRVKAEWTGIMGFTADGFPYVGEVPDYQGLWVCAGFGGHGMVLCWMCARALGEMMEGRDGYQLKEWFPESFRLTKERLVREFNGRLT